MAEDLIVNKGTKEEQYINLIPQISSLMQHEKDLIANLANVSAALKEQFNWFWVGFYLIKNNELVVGPFQGSIACTRIKKGQGVCGTSWEQMQTIVVTDVTQFPNHIACSSRSKSEIVIPIFKDREIIGVLDIDSDRLSAFDFIDKKYLENIVCLIPV